MSKNNFTPLPDGRDPDDVGNNHSANPSMQDILAVSMSRRGLLRSSAGAAVFGSMGLTGCLGLGGSSGSSAREGATGMLAPRRKAFSSRRS